MPKRSNHKENPTSPQAEKFRDLAKQLECDEDEAAFKAKLVKVAKTPRPQKEK